MSKRAKLDYTDKKTDGNVTTVRLAMRPTCPACGALADGAANADGKTPAVGDVSVCGICVNVCIFDERGGLRIPTDEELVELAGAPEIKHIIAAVRSAHANLSEENLRKIRDRSQSKRPDSWDGVVIDEVGEVLPPLRLPKRP